MNPDPILILAAMPTTLLSAAVVVWTVLGLWTARRTDRAEQALARSRQDLETLMDVVNGSIDVLAKVSAESHHNAREAARIVDDLTDLRGEYLAQARALDAHDERLIRLEQDAADLSVAHFKTASTVEDHGDRLDHVERYAPEP